jgi:hypothetical protein
VGRIHQCWACIAILEPCSSIQASEGKKTRTRDACLTEPISSCGISGSMLWNILNKCRRLWRYLHWENAHSKWFVCPTFRRTPPLAWLPMSASSPITKLVDSAYFGSASEQVGLLLSNWSYKFLETTAFVVQFGVYRSYVFLPSARIILQFMQSYANHCSGELTYMDRLGS